MPFLGQVSVYQLSPGAKPQRAMSPWMYPATIDEFESVPGFVKDRREQLSQSRLTA